MEQAKIEGVLVDQLARSRGVDRDAVLSDLNLENQIDSFEGLELVLAVEEAFDITITDKEIASGSYWSVPALTRLVLSKLAE